MAINTLSVLLIDDEEEFIRALASRLELRGMKTRTAFSGARGLDMLRGETPDVVLLDMRMPGLSGLETLRELRVTHPILPVIIITGHCSEQDRDEALALGVRSYYGKPVTFEDLLADLRALERGAEIACPALARA